VPPVSGYLFVDARLPHDGASLFDDTPPDVVEGQRAMARMGWLPPFSEWFGEWEMRDVLPHDVVRRRFLGGLQRIPLALFEEPIPVPEGWPDVPCGYLRLSEVYEPEAAQARASGWPAINLEGLHLQMLVDPPTVTRALLDLVSMSLQV
jgi:hypothetical protein